MVSQFTPAVPPPTAPAPQMDSTQAPNLTLSNEQMILAQELFQ